MADVAMTAGVRPRFSPGYKSTVLAFLLAAYTFNFIDRTIISTIGPKIREDLGLTSTQLGLLGGLYFALLYTILGIPIARLAERWNRSWIITLSLVVWSGFTALCGMAQNFFQLALFRFGVGIGEAGCSPASHSMISDYYEPKQRATALSIYSLGIPLGAMFGAVAGGWIAENLSWRMAFVLVGLPGIALAILFKLIVKEPPRGHADLEAAAMAAGRDAPPPVHHAPPAAKGGLLSELREIAIVTGKLFGKWPVLHMVLGITIASLGGYGVGQFVPQYFHEHFSMGLAQVGLITGLVGGFSSGVGTLAGGYIADRMSRISPVWYTLTPALGLAICTPIYVWAYMQPTWQMAALILLIPGIFHYTYLGPTLAVVQNLVEVRRRATATAVLFFFINLIALGGGPPLVGWIIDQFADFIHAKPVIPDVMTSFLSIFGGAETSSFATECPGGRAPKGASVEAATACKATISEATRQGIIVGLMFYAWGALHYFLGAFGLTKELRAATERLRTDP